MPPLVTESVAGLLVAEPAVFVTTHRNTAPLSAFASAGVVYVVAVAPLIAVPLRCH